MLAVVIYAMNSGQLIRKVSLEPWKSSALKQTTYQSMFLVKAREKSVYVFVCSSTDNRL
jgi:hypothetical protein